MLSALTCKDAFMTRSGSSMTRFKWNMSNFPENFLAFEKNFPAFAKNFLALQETCQFELETTLNLSVCPQSAGEEGLPSQTCQNTLFKEHICPESN